MGKSFTYHHNGQEYIMEREDDGKGPWALYRVNGDGTRSEKLDRDHYRSDIIGRIIAGTNRVSLNV